MLGGRRTPGSGNQWHTKGDVISRDFMGEDKTTKHSSFSLKLDDLKKLERNALAAGRTPVFSVNFCGTNRFIILREEDFRGFCNTRS